MQIEDLLYSQVLEEGTMACHAGGHVGGGLREWAQPSRCGAERK